MLNQPRKAYCLLFFFSMLHLFAVSQCLTAPPAPDCTGSEPLLADNETLNLSATKWFYGATTTFNSLTLNGGTLIVCGNLTIDKFYMDSGTIYVRPGARLVIGSGIGAGLVLKGNSAIYNYGSLEIQRNLSFDNGWSSPSKPNILINEGSSSALNMANQYFVINNKDSWFVNRGDAKFWGIIVDPQSSANSVCLGNKSTTYMTVMYNKVKNSYASPEGQSCVKINQYTQLYDTLTNSAMLNMCLSPSHYSDSSCVPWGCKPKAWGNANLFKSCNACIDLSILNVRFTEFTVSQNEHFNQLSWKMDTDLKNNYFRIERSSDGSQYATINKVSVSSANQNKFSTTDPDPLPGLSYYRVAYVTDAIGLSENSKVVKVNRQEIHTTQAYPNPFTNKIWISLKNKNLPVTLLLFSADGRLILRETLQQQKRITELNVPATLSPGIYLLRIIYDDETVMVKLKKE